MTVKNDDALREDQFLGELVPQVTEHLAEQRAQDFDAGAGQSRFLAWLAANTRKPDNQPDRAGTVTRSTSDRARQSLDGQMCAMLAVDIAAFTHRDSDIQLYLRRAMWEIVQDAFEGSGLPWSECLHEDRGDGVLVILPPSMPSRGLIDPLPDRLRGLIRRHNHVSAEAAQIQLRAAVNIGPVHHDGHGFVGQEINMLYRILDSRALRRALTDSGAELALAVSSYVHENLVVRHPSLVDPALFRPVTIQVKETRTKGWFYVPGQPPP